MLYITTRDKHDTHTANKTLVSNSATDGGLYLPRSMPSYSATEINGFRTKTTTEIFAEILNYFFSQQLTAWDVDFSIGRNPTKIIPIGRKFLIAQTWHNPEHTFAYIEKNIYKKLCQGEPSVDGVTQWLRISVHVALLFTLYSQMLKNEQLHAGQRFDIAVDVNDFTSAIACSYAAKMGMPFGKLVCSCDDSGSFWDLVHRGELNTASISSDLACGIERLLHLHFGADEVQNFLEILAKKGTYKLPEDTECTLTDTMFCAVAGKNRAATVANSVYRTDAYFLDSSAALAYGAVQDYRAKTGSNNLTLILSGKHPVLETDFLTNATGLSKTTFIDKCKTI